MSWYSDGERFDEYEGCGYCSFKNKKSPYTCANCAWNDEDWGDDPCAECDGENCDNCSIAEEEEDE